MIAGGTPVDLRCHDRHRCETWCSSTCVRTGACATAKSDLSPTRFFIVRGLIQVVCGVSGRNQSRAASEGRSACSLSMSTTDANALLGPLVV